MNRKDPEYPVELETQFILRLPEEPAKALREVLKTGESFKNRLSIQIDNEMRHGQVQFDHRLLHGKILDLPTIIESLKTIDSKSVYKTADISQIMICKEEFEPIEEESPTKTKKKDPFKVDKKFLFPHGITPPTKNVRKRRFRKTLKKKSMEAPEIEKEVKRLLRADNEAINVKWEVITEEDESKPETSTKVEKIELKKDQNAKSKSQSNQSSSKVEDIFGGTLSDSDLEEDNINVDIDDSRMSTYDDHFSDSSMMGSREMKGFATQFSSEMFSPSTSTTMNTYGDDSYSQGESSSVSMKLEQVTIELEELRQRKQKTQNEIAGMENMTLRQRFLDTLQTLNKEIKLKEMEYQKLQTQSRLN